MKHVKPDLTVAASATEATLGEARSAQTRDPAKLPSGVFSWAERNEQKTAVGARRDFFDSPTATLANLELHATTLNAGEAPHPPHRHPDEELVIVKEGRLEVTINHQVHYAGPGSVIFYASNDLHGMRNAGDAPATYCVLRWISSAVR